MTKHFDYERRAIMLPAEIASGLDNAIGELNVGQGEWVLDAIKEKLARHEAQPRQAVT